MFMNKTGNYDLSTSHIGGMTSHGEHSSRSKERHGSVQDLYLGVILIFVL